jgi:hypothetical protein
MTPYAVLLKDGKFKDIFDYHIFFRFDFLEILSNILRLCIYLSVKLNGCINIFL